MGVQHIDGVSRNEFGVLSIQSQCRKHVGSHPYTLTDSSKGGEWSVGFAPVRMELSFLLLLLCCPWAFL